MHSANLRIAVVSPFVDRQHGTERAVAELLERLASVYRCEIHLFAQRVEDLRVTRWNTRPVPHHDAEEGVIFWHTVPAIGGPQLFSFVAWCFLNRWSRWAFTHFRGGKFDFVLSPGVNCLDADVVVVHVVFQRLRELALEKSDVDAPASSFLRRLHRRAYYSLLASLERHLYTNPRIPLAAVSQRTATQLAAYFGRHDVRVIPYGIDISEFSPERRLAKRQVARECREIKESDFVLLLIGNDWKVKGLATLLRAMALVRDLPVRLIVVGSDAAGPFEEMAKGLGIFDRCRWERPGGEVLDFYAAADLYVSPSREDSFALPVGEAMATGLPVITTSCAGVSTLIKDGVDSFVLADPEDVDTLAKLFQLVGEQPALRDRIGGAAAKTARAWTWDRNAAATWEFLKSIGAKQT
jgi:glycosyltransferase involved in cell wall biosynthesis